MMLNDMYLGVLLSAGITLWCVFDSVVRVRRFHAKNGYVRHPRVSALFVGLQVIALAIGVFGLLNSTRAALALALPAVIMITAFPYGFLRQMLEPVVKRKRRGDLTEEKAKLGLEDQAQFVADDGEIMEVVDDEKPKRSGNSQGG
jgi:hypothetical protein